MYQHGTIFSLNNRMFIYMVWTWEIHILIQLLKYITFDFIMCTNCTYLLSWHIRRPNPQLRSRKRRVQEISTWAADERTSVSREPKHLLKRNTAWEIQYYNKMLRSKISHNMTKTIVDVQQIGRHGASHR